MAADEIQKILPTRSARVNTVGNRQPICAIALPPTPLWWWVHAYSMWSRQRNPKTKCRVRSLNWIHCGLGRRRTIPAQPNRGGE